MRNTLLIFVLLVIGCTPRVEHVSEAEVIKTVKGFFDALHVDNDNPDLIDEYTTADFMLYEAGVKMNKSEFIKLVLSFPMLESDWELSDFRITTDVNSAHISLFNKGRFVLESDSTNVVEHFEWLESAFLVKEDDKLKIKFYFSDNIKVYSEPQ